MLFHQRTDSTERGILVKAARRVRVVDICRYITGPAPWRVNESGSEGLLKYFRHKSKTWDCVFLGTVPLWMGRSQSENSSEIRFADRISGLSVT